MILSMIRGRTATVEDDEEPPPDPEPEPFNGQIGILGDSNGVGQGKAEEIATGITDPYVLAKIDTKFGTGASSTVPRQDVQPYAAFNVPSMGFELTIARGVVPGLSMETILQMSKSAMNGTTMAQWIPGSGFPVSPPYLFDRMTTYFDNQCALTETEMKVGVQVLGTNDAATDLNTDAFSDNQEAFYEGWMLKYPNSLLIVCQLNIHTSTASITAGRRDSIRQDIVDFVAAHPTNTRLADLDALTLTDGAHYAAAGYRDGGTIISNLIVDFFS